MRVKGKNGQFVNDTIFNRIMSVVYWLLKKLKK